MADVIVFVLGLLLRSSPQEFQQSIPPAAAPPVAGTIHSPCSADWRFHVQAIASCTKSPAPRRQRNDAQASAQPLTLQAAACDGMHACRGSAACHRVWSIYADIKPDHLILREPVTGLNDGVVGIDAILVDASLAAEIGGKAQMYGVAEGAHTPKAPQQMSATRGATCIPRPPIDPSAISSSLLCLFGTHLPTEGRTD